MKLHSLLLAGFLFVTLPLASSFAQVGISINIAPPVLPVFEQPPCPVEGYIWTPGYWAWGVGGYYLVPGVWVAPPTVGLLWTPPWWGWSNGVYVFNQGYWGPTVGFYGGINYGFGYFGTGYWGGRWEGNTFVYNTAVTRVNTTVIHNTFEDRSVLSKEVNRSRASFNGPHGIKAEATAQEKAAAEHKVPPTSQQVARQEAASKDHNLQASVNHGNPNPDAIKSFNQTHEHGQGAEGPGAGAGAGKGEDKTGNVSAEHHHEGARIGTGEEHGNKHEKHNVEGNEAKAHTNKGAQHGPHQTNQQMTHHQQQMVGHHPPPQGGNRPHSTGQQQQGKKKPNKP